MSRYSHVAIPGLFAAVLVFTTVYLEAASVPILTIQSPDGDWVDCYDPATQGAFDHPLLKNHTFQERPSDMPTTVGEEPWGWQTWHENGTKCPEGSVPIRRWWMFGNTTTTESNAADSPTRGHEYALGYMNSKPKIYGTQVTMNVWRPKIEKFGEFSLGQVWLVAGTYDDGDLNSIEAGWQVFPKNYFDQQPRLFTFWTSDAYKNTGCYNIRCSGFVQTSRTILIEGAIAKASIFGGMQMDLTIKIWKDHKLECWWLAIVFDNGVVSAVGYWPSAIFTRLTDYAEMVRWGGEITNMNDFRHTRTEMGSGYFPDSGFGKAAYMRNLEIALSESDFQPVQDLQIGATNPDFYGVRKSKKTAFGAHFYYGGPVHARAVRLSIESVVYFSFGLLLVLHYY